MAEGEGDMREFLLALGLAYSMCALVHRLDGHTFLQSLFFWWWGGVRKWAKTIKFVLKPD